MAINYFTIAVIAVSVLCIAVGLLLGLFRGFSRSLVRLILVVASTVAAWFLRPIISKTLMGLEIGGKSINSVLAEAFAGDIPQSVVTLAYALVEIMIGLLAFIIVFFVLKLLTYLILFPIIKIFLGKEKKGRLLGALIGTVQGVLVAFLVCVPFTGIIGELNNIAAIDVSLLSESDSAESQTNPVRGMLDDIGITEDTIDEYLTSPVGEIYLKAGKPLYVAMTTTTDANGKKITLSAAVGAAKNGIKMAANTKDIMNTMQDISSEGGATEENIGTVCDKLKELDEIKNDTTEEEAEIINSVIKDVIETVASSGATDEEKEQIQEAIDKIGDQIDIKQIEFGAAADAVETIVKIADVKSTENPEEPSAKTEITQEDADKIVNGLAKNEMLVTILETQLTGGEVGSLVQMSEDDKDKFLTAIDNVEEGTISEEYREKMKQLLGLITSGENSSDAEIAG